MRSLVLFTPEGLGTPQLFGQWRQKGGLRPLQAHAVLIERDRTASVYFQQVWRAAFPGREPMPREAVANRDGTGTDRFWDVFG
mgnify:FL=1